MIYLLFSYNHFRLNDRIGGATELIYDIIFEYVDWIVLCMTLYTWCRPDKIWHMDEGTCTTTKNVLVVVDIKILWWIHNRPIVHDKIFVIKLISIWWRGQSANEIKPRGKIKWRKPYGSVGRKDLYGKFLLNEIPN